MSNTSAADPGRVGRALRVFMSYATPDRAVARQLETLLSQRANLRVFTTDALSAGEDWEPKLRDEIARSDVFMVLLSPESLASKWVLHELGAAWALKKPIIPVLTRPDSSTRVPVELRDRKLVDLNSLDSPEAIAELLKPYAEPYPRGG